MWLACSIYIYILIDQIFTHSQCVYNTNCNRIDEKIKWILLKHIIVRVYMCVCVCGLSVSNIRKLCNKKMFDTKSHFIKIKRNRHIFLFLYPLSFIVLKWSAKKIWKKQEFSISNQKSRYSWQVPSQVKYLGLRVVFIF